MVAQELVSVASAVALVVRSKLSSMNAGVDVAFDVPQADGVADLVRQESAKNVEGVDGLRLQLTMTSAPEMAVLPA